MLDIANSMPNVSFNFNDSDNDEEKEPYCFNSVENILDIPFNASDLEDDTTPRHEDDIYRFYCL